MWTDTYCYIDQCGAYSGATPPGAALFPPTADDAFSRSVGGMIWPRSFVGAAAFWHYNASVDPTSPAFVDSIANLTRTLQARGAYVCPAGCYCDQLTACGQPYQSPAPGTPVQLKACSGSPLRWTLASGHLALQSNASLCVTGGSGYPVVLGDCNITFTHTSEGLLSGDGGLCLDVRTVDGAVGLWACGGDQPNQLWSVDPESGFVSSLSNYGPGDQRDEYAGLCLTA
jgi:hypothetical protein